MFQEKCPANGRFPNTDVFCLNEVMNISTFLQFSVFRMGQQIASKIATVLWHPTHVKMTHKAECAIVCIKKHRTTLNHHGVANPRDITPWKHARKNVLKSAFYWMNQPSNLWSLRQLHQQLDRATGEKGSFNKLLVAPLPGYFNAM